MNRSITVPERNWPSALARIIALADEGTTIVVHSESIREMGQRAARRLGKSGLKFKIEDRTERAHNDQPSA